MSLIEELLKETVEKNGSDLHFVAGAHWFTWKDFDSAKRRANRGLVRSDGEPWRELTDALTKVHNETIRREGK